MGHVSDRADRFAKKFVPDKPVETTQAEKEATFAKDWMTSSGLNAQRKKIKETRGKNSARY